MNIADGNLLLQVSFLVDNKTQNHSAIRLLKFIIIDAKIKTEGATLTKGEVCDIPYLIQERIHAPEKHNMS